MINEKKFREIYDDFLESGLTAKDFCANRQIKEAKFYYWKRRLKDDLSLPKGFIPMVFDSSPRVPTSGKNKIESLADQGICCEINYPSGVSIKLKQYPDLSILRSLVLLTH